MKKEKQEEGIQVNKYISNSGFCSRREADKLVEQFRVTINGELALPTFRVMPGDVVAVDDEAIKSKQKPIYIALNKPVGVTSTTDLSDRTNITVAHMLGVCVLADAALRCGRPGRAVLCLPASLPCLHLPACCLRPSVLCLRPRCQYRTHSLPPRSAPFGIRPT
jgi:ribosomal 50S subunit-recycling heat shock protein